MKDLAKSGAIDADLASAFDASPNPYMLLTPDLRYAGMNQAYAQAVGKSRDQLVGRAIFDIFDAGPTDQGRENQRRLRESFERVLRTGRRDHLALIPYALPVTDAEGRTTFQERFWSATHTPIRDEDGRIAYILQHTSDITELELLRRRFAGLDRSGEDRRLDPFLSGKVLARAESVQADNRRLEGERNRLFEMFMQAPGFMALLSGPDHRFEMHNAAYAALIGHRDIAGKPLAEALPEVLSQGFGEILDRVRDTGEAFTAGAAPVQLQRTAGAPPETLYLDFIFQPLRHADGEIAGIFIQGHDVTEAHLADQRQRLMIDELNHRVKNTLATVQSIAMQTARSHAEPRSFAEGFQARLLALSHTHNLLTRSHWEGADLRDILLHETEAHGSQRVSVTGPSLALQPASALSLGMVFHELATNAAKYGALSQPGGRVLVDWSVRRDPDGVERVHVAWREVGGPPARPPERKGFGSRLIERNIRHDLAGEANLDYAPEGFVAEFSFPLERGVTA